MGYSEEIVAFVLSPEFVRAVFGGALRLGKTPFKRVVVRAVELRGKRVMQISRFDGRKDLTSNVEFGEAGQALADVLRAGFANVHVVLAEEEIDVRLTRKGEVIVGRRKQAAAAVEMPPHDRLKETALVEGDDFLEAMGVTDRHGKVRPAMRDKFTQINEFLKLLKHVLPEVTGDIGGRELRILDCGCGASYLTLAVHHYLNQVKGIKAQVLGVDVNEQVIAAARDRSRQYGEPGGVEFRWGKIGELAPGSADIVLALHACDTATDEALAQGVNSGAKLILAVPCCHKHLNSRLKVEALAPIQRHGILHQRQADLVTDAFRALLLRVMGYRTDVIEFISPEHTARNLMIRAVKSAAPGDRRFLAEYRAFKSFCGVTPYLESLLLPSLPALGNVAGDV